MSSQNHFSTKSLLDSEAGPDDPSAPPSADGGGKSNLNGPKKKHVNSNYDPSFTGSVKVHDLSYLSRVAGILPTMESGYGVPADGIVVKGYEGKVREGLRRGKRSSTYGRKGNPEMEHVRVTVDEEFEEERRKALGQVRGKMEGISEDMKDLRRKYLGVEEKELGLALTEDDLEGLVTDDEGEGSGLDDEDNDDDDEYKDDDEQGAAVTGIPPAARERKTNERRLSVEEIKDLSRFNDWGNFETSCGEEELAERLGGDWLALSRAYPFNAPDFQSNKPLLELMEKFVGIGATRSEDESAGSDDALVNLSDADTLDSNTVGYQDEDDDILKMTMGRADTSRAVVFEGDIGRASRNRGKSALMMAREKAMKAKMS